MAQKPDTPLVIGSHRGQPISIDADARRRHFLLLGSTGVGKSTALASCIGRDVAAGHGVILLDPHGDLCEQVLTLVPTWRAHELVYLNAGDLARPIGLNPLDLASDDPLHQARIADDIVAAFVHVFGAEAVQARSQQILRNALRALMSSPGMTLVAVPRLLTDDAFRARILARVRDPMVRAYFRDQFDAHPPRWRAEITTAIQNKLDGLLAGALRNILGQRSTFSIRTIMEGRILIVNLGRGAIGEGPSTLLGAFLMSAIATAALSRIDTPPHDRRPVYLYADEFQTYAASSFNLLLNEARKYAVALTLATQHTLSLPEHLRHAVLANCGTLIAFRLGAEEAPLIARQLGLGFPDPNPQALTDLANHTAYGKLLLNGAPTDALLLEMPPPPRPINHRPHRLITNSRVRFGRERAAVEARLARFFGTR